MKPGTFKLNGKVPHITLCAEQGLKCRCGQSATNFVLCRKCRNVVCTCMGHQKTIDDEAREHCQ
jgi:hypothetical protein